MPQPFVALLPGEGEVVNCILPAETLSKDLSRPRRLLPFD